jgi:hypothetical protein
MSKSNIPSLINGSAGKPKSATAGKRCLCKGCGASMAKGERCVDIPNPRAAFSSARRFCVNCFRRVIEKTKADITLFEAEFENIGTS